MAEDVKKINGCCEGMPFTELMRKMKGGQGLGSPCAEMMKKIMSSQKEGYRIFCAEMMQKIMKEGSKVQNKAEEAKEEESHVKGKH